MPQSKLWELLRAKGFKRLKDLNKYNVDADILLLLIKERRIATLKRILENERSVNLMFYWFNGVFKHRDEPKILYHDDQYIVVLAKNYSWRNKKTYGDGFYPVQFVICRSEDGFWSIHRIPFHRIKKEIRSRAEVRELLGYDVDYPELEENIIDLEKGQVGRIQGDLIIECLGTIEDEANFLVKKIVDRIAFEYHHFLYCKLAQFVPRGVNEFYKVQPIIKWLRKHLTYPCLDGQPGSINHYLSEAIKKVMEKLVEAWWERIGKHKYTLLKKFYELYESEFKVTIGNHIIHVHGSYSVFNIYIGNFLLLKRVDPMNIFQSFRFLVMEDMTKMEVYHRNGDHSPRVYYLKPGVYSISLLPRHQNN